MDQKIENIMNNIRDILQDSDMNRDLDSLEIITVQTAIRTEGIDIDEGSAPNEKTLGGWKEWLIQYSQDG